MREIEYSLPVGRPYWRKEPIGGGHFHYHFMVGNTTLASIEANPEATLIPDAKGVLYVPTHVTIFADLPDHLPGCTDSWDAVDCNRFGGVRIIHRLYRAWACLQPASSG